MYGKYGAARGKEGETRRNMRRKGSSVMGEERHLPFTYVATTQVEVQGKAKHHDTSWIIMVITFQSCFLFLESQGCYVMFPYYGTLIDFHLICMFYL